jgi:predicted nucleotidyltransferase
LDRVKGPLSPVPFPGTNVPIMGTTQNDLGATLFGKTRRAVLALAYGNPDESFHLRRIARFAGTGMGVLQRELVLLTEAGILHRTVSGRQVYFQANPACPIFDELERIVTKTAGIADVVRGGLVTLGERVAIAFLYGSFTRGTQRAGSDVDVLVVGDVSFGEVVEALAAAQERIGRELNPTVYPPREFQDKVRERQHFVTRVMAEPKVFLIGGERELVRLAEERLAE